MEYQHEMVAWADVQAALDARAAAGWRLVSAIKHDNQHEGTAPDIILFWERTVP